MSPEKQRICISEACGWRHVRDLGVGLPGPVGHHPERFIENEPRVEFMESVPDYLNDLNAIHEAEKTLSNEDWDDKFYHWIGFVVSGGQTSQLWEYRKMVVHATAAQRAEAFLKCLNLWKDQ